MLDQNGVIRYRDVRGQDLETAVAALMAKSDPKSTALAAPNTTDADSRDLRNWTRTDGRKAQLRFLSLDGDKVRFRRPDGREHVVPLAELSQADQEWIREHAKK